MHLFPILKRRSDPGMLRGVPWGMMEPHERQADYNHSQTLKRLAERGGLSCCEMLAVLEDRPWHKMDKGVAEAAVIVKIAEFNNEEDKR